jgi:hypothetical protein
VIVGDCGRFRQAILRRSKFGALRLDRGYSAQSLRAACITTAPETGAQLEDVQKTAGQRDPSKTKLYDRRGYYPEKAGALLCRVLTSNEATWPTSSLSMRAPW